MTTRAGRRGLAGRALGLWLVAALALAACGERAGREGKSESEGEGEATEHAPAPDFEHPDLLGSPVRLSSLRGQTVIIDFWATWCPPCVFQPSELNTFWDKHGKSGKVAVIGVEVGGASVDEIREWAHDHDAVARYPILTGADEDLARRFGAMGFPALVVVAPDGTIDSIHLGLTTANELEQHVAHLLDSDRAS